MGREESFRAHFYFCLKSQCSFRPPVIVKSDSIFTTVYGFQVEACKKISVYCLRVAAIKSHEPKARTL
jgi:hypothetical protein